MKKILPILFLICTLSFLSQAQERQGGGRIEALKIAYITKKLNLSPEEAQKFWPVYNKYSSELRQARADQRSNKATVIKTEEKILNIRKKYNKEFGNVLSADKVDTFFRSEKEFSSYVQKELSERRQLRQQQGNQQSR